MNYLTVRFLIILLLLFLHKKKVIMFKTKKANCLFWIVFAVVFFIIIPERFFLKFNNLDSVFNYTFPYKKQVFATENDKYGFVVFREGTELDVAYFKRDNSKYPYFYPFFSHSRNFYANGHSIIIQYIIESNGGFIYIDSLNDKKVKVIDSLGNKYQECDVERKHNYYYYLEELPEDYYILIDNDKIVIN